MRLPSWKPTALIITVRSGWMINAWRPTPACSAGSRSSCRRSEPSGAHELAIRVWGRGAAQASESALASGHPLAARQGQSGHRILPQPDGDSQGAIFVWLGFAPRLLSTGIWDDIRLVVTHAAYIEDLWVLAGPMAEVLGGGERRRRDAGTF